MAKEYDYIILCINSISLNSDEKDSTNYLVDSNLVDLNSTIDLIDSTSYIFANFEKTKSENKLAIFSLNKIDDNILHATVLDSALLHSSSNTQIDSTSYVYLHFDRNLDNWLFSVSEVEISKVSNSAVIDSTKSDENPLQIYDSTSFVYANFNSKKIDSNPLFETSNKKIYSSPLENKIKTTKDSTSYIYHGFSKDFSPNYLLSWKSEVSKNSNPEKNVPVENSLPTNFELQIDSTSFIYNTKYEIVTSNNNSFFKTYKKHSSQNNYKTTVRQIDSTSYFYTSFNESNYYLTYWNTQINFGEVIAKTETETETESEIAFDSLRINIDSTSDLYLNYDKNTAQNLFFGRHITETEKRDTVKADIEKDTLILPKIELIDSTIFEPVKIVKIFDIDSTSDYYLSFERDTLYSRNALKKHFVYPKEIAVTEIVEEVASPEITEANKAGAKDWFFFVTLLSIGIVGFLKVFYDKQLRANLFAIYNKQESNRIFNDNSALTNRVSIFLLLLFALNLSMFLIECSSFYGILLTTSSKLITYFALSIIIILLNVLKIFQLSLLGKILKIQDTINEYIHEIYIHNKAIGISLFPIIIFMPFVIASATKAFVYTGFGLIVVFSLLRIFRGAKIIFTKRLSIFYMILYLCTLEILPILIILKFIKSFM